MPPPPPPGPPPPPPGQNPDDKEKDKDKEGDKGDGYKVRLRGGFSFGGGIVSFPGPDLKGPALMAAGRIGVQIKSWVGVYYQNTPNVTLIVVNRPSGLEWKAGFADYNSFMAAFSLGHIFEVAAGPSVDFLAISTGGISLSSDPACILNPSSCVPVEQKDASGVHFGGHLRAAFTIGSFAIGADLHSTVLPGSSMVTATLNFGAEWY